MSDKKVAGPAPSSDDKALEKRVEMIMGERLADGVTPAPRVSKFDDQPAIDIFKDAAKTPGVSPDLLAQIGAEPTADPAKAEAAAPPDTATDEPTDDTKAPDSANLDDANTDKAVDDIVVNEGDTVLAAADAASQPTKTKPAKAARFPKLKHLLSNKWTWIIAGVVLVAVFALPFSRYKLLGLVIKQTVTVSVTDSTSHTPVSSATVVLAGKTGKSDASGKVSLRVPVGPATLSVSKQYYKSHSSGYSVGFSSGQKATVALTATGRQVPITVVNKITGKPLAGVQISVLDTTAKTNQKGQAIIVLPASAVSDAASLSLSGYNTAHVSVQVTSQVVATNSFSLTPAGHLYFLSNLSGKIDVVKSNLDGTGRQTVLAGTGKEDPNSTSLLASRDWRFLVLKAQRDTPQAGLYLIDTATDKVTNFDSGDADFTLVGWYGHAFIYDVTRNTVSSWQNGHEALKSYNADTAQLNLLDQNQAEGNSSFYAYQGFYNFYIINGLITYNTQWYTYSAGGSSYDLSSKNNTIRGIQPSGQGKKDYQSLPASGIGYIQAALYEPQSLYYAVYNYNDNKTTYYKFDDGTVSTTTLDQSSFNKTYPTFLLAPSSNQTFWTEFRDGKNALFVGDANAASSKQIATLSDYSPYGWYSDNYVLVSKNSSELYIMPVGGVSGSQQPLKITDYYKPAQTFNGYGYGYGGL